ncbi:MAG: hypothetical protein M1825_000264 [Sarcosagium campestre]|nr:MAG: hypothetical protein M1825_000264 [Sarcosagium campestre]
MADSSQTVASGDDEESQNPYEPRTYASQPEPRRHSLTRRILGSQRDGSSQTPAYAQRGSSRERVHLGEDSLTAQMQQAGNDSKGNGSPRRTGALPRPVGGQGKLGTFSGVFVPTSLNVLSILMFIRFGFLIGQGGVLGMMCMLVAAYFINLVTTLSISAIATNGTVRGGGAYYLISRSLGPEFGGSIGLVLYLGFAFNTGMNAVGLIDCLNQNFGGKSGNWHRWLPENFWFSYLWATVVLLACTAICLAGSGIFARASNALLAILLVATFSIPLSALIVPPFQRPDVGLTYTGLSGKTFKENFLPRLTRGAAGSVIHGKENFQDLFGILFPAAGGIFAGASMSGDLKHPSKAIPTGTLAGLGLTFIAYTLVVFAMAATTTRQSLYSNLSVVQDTNMSAVLILLGEFATTLFSTLMGVIGSAKLLQALARDDLLPGFSIFGQGTSKGDEPTYAIIITYLVAQLTMLCDINQIASFVSMAYLMTFLVTNLACFLLKLSSAPNFRPSFRYFNVYTAGAGTVISGAMMFFVDGVYASACVGILIAIFLVIHYTSPPKSWGDVSQSLIYHQVRKYLLRLRQEHVKFWRPQIILLVNDPRRQYKLIQFCNSLKKGALYILGHVIVSEDFGSAVPEARRQQAAWTKYIDFSKVKAFVNIAISPGVEWGTRNIVLGSGLGGMRPNIAVMGFYNLAELAQRQPLIDLTEPPNADGTGNPTSRTTATESEILMSLRRRRPSATKRVEGALPTDTCRSEHSISVTSYMSILEDLLLRVQINVAVAKGFQGLELPDPAGKNTKKYIDLWPIQMSAEVTAGEGHPDVLTTNFDTYTLILQLGVIINTVPAWKKSYKLRVAVFVEYESDVEEERERVKALLDNLRIQAEVLVFWLAKGDLQSYEIVVNGKKSKGADGDGSLVDDELGSEEWWQEMQRLRGHRDDVTPGGALAELQNDSPSDIVFPSPSMRTSQTKGQRRRFEGLKRLLKKQRRSHSMSGITRLGVALGMRTHRLNPQLIDDYSLQHSASENSDTGESDDEDAISIASERSAASDDARVHTSGRWGRASQGARSGDSTIKRSKSLGDDVFDYSRLCEIERLQAQQHKPSVSSAPREPGSLPSKATLSALAKEDEATSNQGSSTPETTADNQTPRKSTLENLKGERPQPARGASMGKFTSKPVPLTKVAAEDGPGPSIMFTESTSPARRPGARQDSGKPGYPATGYPFPQAVPLSFNDLPCRAQHLILNELMRKQSDDTAVVFTTLPSPVEGTSRSLDDSVGYLSDLEILCRDLPPVLLVHSNSMTVTMNL